jgi:hypothetical protein
MILRSIINIISIINIHGACKPPCGAPGCDGMRWTTVDFNRQQMIVDTVHSMRLITMKNRRRTNEQWTIWGVNF